MSRMFDPVPARRGPVRLMIGLTAPGGAGKTFSALRLATGIRSVVPGPIVVIDTENGRALHYADRFSFTHLPFDRPFGSEDYVEALRSAAGLEPSVIVLDSFSHEHEGEGGFLDLQACELERLAPHDAMPPHRITQAAWRAPRLARRRLQAALLNLDCHLIVCMRANERTRAPREPGEADPVDMGFTPIAGPEFLYELTLGCLLRPGAAGVPTLASDRPGEAMAIKHPVQTEPLIRPGEALCETHGAALARWAAGPGSAIDAAVWIEAAQHRQQADARALKGRQTDHAPAQKGQAPANAMPDKPAARRAARRAAPPAAPRRAARVRPLPARPARPAIETQAPRDRDRTGETS